MSEHILFLTGKLAEKQLRQILDHMQLLEDAERESKLVRRSIPKQIEQWADLGRHVERFLSRNDLIALQQG